MLVLDLFFSGGRLLGFRVCIVHACMPWNSFFLQYILTDYSCMHALSSLFSTPRDY